MPSIDPQVEALIAAEFTTNEKLLWAGQPDPSQNFMKADWFFIPGSLLIASGALILLAAIASNFQDFITDRKTAILVGGVTLIFLVMALFMGVLRFWFKRRFKRRIYYAISNRRAFLPQARAFKCLVAGPLENFQTIRRRVRANGTGHLLLGWQIGQFGGFDNTGMDLGGSFAPDGIAFYDLKKADEVYRIAEQARMDRLDALAAKTDWPHTTVDPAARARLDR